MQNIHCDKPLHGSIFRTKTQTVKLEHCSILHILRCFLRKRSFSIIWWLQKAFQKQVKVSVVHCSLPFYDNSFHRKVADP